MKLRFTKRKRGFESPSNMEIKKIKDLLKENKIIFSVDKLFRIGEVSFKDAKTLEGVKDAILNKDLDYLLRLNDIDVTQDLIQVYLVIDEKGNNILIGIIDPYELYDNPRLFATSENINLENIVLEERRIK